MSRPWIEFIQSQNLPWESPSPSTFGDGVEVKQLSSDTDSGALSLLLRLPPGYQQTAGAIAADEEFLVLDGGLTIGDQDYGQYAYAHWPAGYAAAARYSEHGAVILAFFSARPEQAPAAAFDQARLVEYCDGLEVPYTGKFHAEFPPGAGRKVLYTDPDTGETSWLLGTLPLRWAERSEVHDAVEEMFLLSGEVHSDRGVMRPGAYFWRPPHIPHGPFGTLTGNLYFFRTKGGPLRTEYVAPKKPFRWWPEHAPELPDELAPLGRDSERLPRRW